ncbi:MAG TPA: glycosyltransferase family 2 protein [Bacteroidota bacterium]|nr:glycosyltransferase family 2 protein [Bacteroidota bacterium]
MGPPSPLVSIVIVNYNGRHFLADCLASVFAQAYPAFETILVDNGSSDGSVPFIRAQFPAVRVLEAGRNLGFAGGNNLGVASARGELIALLNTDTVVHPRWLHSLVEASRADDVAIVSSLVLTKGIPDRYYERNGSINFICHNIMRVFEQPENIFYGGGASLLFKKQLLTIPFDDDYFAYGEDVYLGLRARFMGYRILHTNASVVSHEGGATSKAHRATRVEFLQERNRLLNIFIFFSPWVIVRILPLIAASSLAKLCVGIFSHRRSAWAVPHAFAWILAHPGVLRRKRQALRREQHVSEGEVISWMTAKLTNGESRFGRIVNACAVLYCRLVGLRTIESLPPGTR